MADPRAVPDQSGAAPMVTLAHFERTVHHAQSERDEARQECIRLRGALEHLMEFGKRLMDSANEDERGIGCCIAEGARVIEPDSATPDESQRGMEDTR